LHPVVKTVLERLGLGLATLFFVSIIIFSAIEMLPGVISSEYVEIPEKRGRFIILVFSM
jgi:ABC-type dipeptide/oligopeptide/nickel transport system permease component